MPAFEVRTAGGGYQNIVERGILRRASEFLPAKRGPLFVVTNAAIWELHGKTLDPQIAQQSHLMFLPDGEPNKRLACIEMLADQMIENGADRSSVVVGFGGGIVTDVGGFLAAIFMRGVPVLQIPTTLLGQVDAAIGGKTGVNLVRGKNLIGSFHQPVAVLIDPELLSTLPEREYRAGLFEVIKCAIIRDRKLFDLLEAKPAEVLARDPATVDALISAAARIKTEVVSADEREGDLRRILNFGHTIGHAIEAETEYTRFLHGEAVAWGMLAAIRLAELTGEMNGDDAESMRRVIRRYGPIPPAGEISSDKLMGRLASDKKTLQGKIHFVLPTGIGQVKVATGIDSALIKRAIAESFC